VLVGDWLLWPFQTDQQVVGLGLYWNLDLPSNNFTPTAYNNPQLCVGSSIPETRRQTMWAKHKGWQLKKGMATTPTPAIIAGVGVVAIPFRFTLRVVLHVVVPPANGWQTKNGSND
jgi:hypothetical protein